ncbi:hypothetical protein PG987_010171 [Apiospora arundinis]
MERPFEIRSVSTSSTTKSFLSRTLTRRGQDQDDEPKGPLGLTTLHEPVGNVPVVADVIFVHGLNGGSYSTWSKGNNPSHFWPQEWLPRDEAFKDVRIHTFGYPSAVGRDSILNVHDFARSLLAAVRDSPTINRDANTSIIFISHSMGGLVVKKAYIIGQHEAEFQPVVERIRATFFLATPHHGAGIAQTLARLLSMVPGARPFVEDLIPQSTALQSINEDFPRVCSKLQILSFFETRPMTIGVSKVLIVEKTSAVMNLPNERRTLLDADHRNAAMYSSTNDASFIAVRNALATVVSAQRRSSRFDKQILLEEDEAAISKFLGISGSPEDDLMNLEATKLPGSCEWLIGKDYYQSWRESLDSSFLWLRGRPGAGKSVLAGHVVHDLRDRELDCCFYFFQSSDKAKSNANTCLRSIAWQMAKHHPEIAAKLKEVMAEWRDNPVDQIDPSPVWRKVFLSGILKVRLNRPQFWIIDAMDECKGSTDMMGFLTRIQEQWPLSIIVTSRDLVEVHLSTANPRIDIRSYAITDDDVKQDIQLFLRSNAQLLPCPSSERWPTVWDMASQIIQNSGGCFLWVSLICSELREVTSEREINKVLESIPSNMNALYSKILRDMEAARFGKELAKALITWTTYAFRPLNTVEIQDPIELDINDKIDDVERAISKSCGNLVYVDTYGKVQLIHSTAREFLTGKDVSSDFATGKAEGHRRLAMVCLKFLMQGDKATGKSRRLGSDPEVRTIHTPPASSSRRLASDSDLGTIIESGGANTRRPVAPFTNYASIYLFHHLNLVHSTDNEIFVLLSKFLSGNSVLRWIEYIATHGDLRTIYQAGRVLNSLLSRREQHSPPISLSHTHKSFAMLDKWGDDLIHLVAKFSRFLRLSPHVIHHLIPAFCPPDSAIRRQFSDPYRGLDVQGLSATGWDDCIATITYPKGMKPNSIAAGLGFFAVGMLNPVGSIYVYEDSIFQESHNFQHREPVWRMAFSEGGKYLASAGAKTVRVWSTTEGLELCSFKIPSLCIAIAFTDDDTVLLVATKQNQFIEWDMEQLDFFQGEAMTWTTDLEETVQSRTPIMAAISPWTSLLSVIYRGEDIIMWSYADDRIHDVYEKDTGSISLYGSYKLAEGATSVRAVTFSQALDTNRLAATYTDGDLVIYDISSGMPLASADRVNTMLLASSHDGRTLAGVDSSGNVTLFEFDTLRPLYRVRFGTQILPKGFTFTADNLRFIEIRGDQCRIWEPTVLHRTDTQDEENSDTVSVSTRTHEIDFLADDTIPISAVVCCQSSSVVFCASNDGSVHAFDISGSPKNQLLFVQTQDCPLELLYFDEPASILVCGDLSGRITARRLARRNRRPQQAIWDADEPLIDTRSPGHGSLKQILVSGTHSRLLVSTEAYDTLWPMPKQGEGVWVEQLPRGSRSAWLAHPTKLDSIICLEESQLVVYRWTDLKPIRTVLVPLESTVDRLISLSHPRYFATAARSVPDRAKGAYKSIQLWDISLIDEHDSISAPANQLDATFAADVELVIGAFGSRLVVYTTDYWIASVELASVAPTGSSSSASPCLLLRHFFVPNDWISVVHKLIVGIGRLGEIVFAKRSELAIIKRGLEVTESGGSFNPRRDSYFQKQQHYRTGSSPSSSSAAGAGSSLMRRRAASSPLSSESSASAGGGQGASQRPPLPHR